MSHGDVIIRFDQVSFAYTEDKPILDEASFSVRENAKITIMGQNGAGKSTIFQLIVGTSRAPEWDLRPTAGAIHIRDQASIGIATQVMPKKFFDYTVLEYFATAFAEKKYNLEKLIRDALAVVSYAVPLNKKVGELSGGQQARLLLAYAIIQKPDILLLDEPTNNLDADGIAQLTAFLIMYDKTVLVISHDANFLNAFTDGVLNLDVYTKKVEQYVGNYFDVATQIAAQIEREEKKNAQLRKNIQDRKDKVNFFAHKGGKMRKLASKLREEVAEDEANMVEVKRDDKTIRSFRIAAQPWSEVVAAIDSVDIIVNHERRPQPANLELWHRDRLQIVGSNGIGKSTLLREMALNAASGARISPGVKIGYYRQDFSDLNMESTVYDVLGEMLDVPDNETIYATGAQFLLAANLMINTVGSLSEGQKGLLCYARFVLQKPGILILDEPTNHINFRHLPIIAQAIDEFDGAVIVVSHMPEFMEQIHITQTLDLEKLLEK
ncbi:MAG: ABC-F family ATP-binding cassette domain-containing protein [Candidatus Magasanikbacteria bacterium]|nr:ABC-F family ATP-binding cassette domain-containing protein [Candidatus Magasanikbacteria bacterium]